MESITREEHRKDVDILHDRISKNEDAMQRIEMSVVRIEESSKRQQETWQRIYDEVYGKDRIKESVIGLAVHRTIQWFLISGVFIALLGISGWIIKTRL